MKLQGLLFSFILSVLIWPAAFSQNTIVRGKINVVVVNEMAAPVADATVSVMNAKDSSLVKIGLTDKTGSTEFGSIKEGNYFLLVTHAGFRKEYSEMFAIHSGQLALEKRITLIVSGSNLEAVTVSARRPFIERQFDKLIVNVEASITAAGSSAFDILERSPGITIDQNDNISMKGKNGVVLMIDGRISPLSGPDLANMLRGLPSDAIEKIELISNPSARYDAAGTAGIINIRMKKDQRVGTNGNLTTGTGYGKYWRHNEGLSFNHRNKKVNIFGSYNFSDRKLYNELNIVRRFFDAITDTMTGGFDQFSVMHFRVNNHTARIGADFFPTSKTVFGFVFNMLSNNISRDINNQAKALNYFEGIDSFFTTLNTSDEKLRHYGLNINFKHTFDSTGKELTVDLDYARYASNMDPRLATTYYDLGGNEKGFPYILDGSLNGRLHIYSVKADYIQPLKKAVKVEAGIKSSYVKADNDLVFYEEISGISQYDASKSNHFIYEESINAAYINISKAWKKINTQVGFRAEHTNGKGLQVASGQRLNTSYLRIFPSATFNYTLKNNDILGVSISRRIDRPTYSQLNPFKYYIDPTSYREGNPGLRPQFTYAYEFSYTRKQTIATLSYGKTTDNLLWVLIPAQDGNKIYSVETTRNLAIYHGFGVSVTSGLKIAKWWNSQNNLDLYYSIYKGELANTSLNNGGPSFNMSNNNMLTFNKSWSGEVTVYYQARQRVGYAIAQSVFRLAAGAQKVIMNKKGTLRLNVSDIFFTDYPRVTSTFNIYKQFFKARRNSRVAQLTFTYRFGKNTVPGARRRTGGAEEEKNRAN
jgi:iron complex outermembrane receptor protein